MFLCAVDSDKMHVLQKVLNLSKILICMFHRLLESATVLDREEQDTYIVSAGRRNGVCSLRYANLFVKFFLLLETDLAETL